MVPNYPGAHPPVSVPAVLVSCIEKTCAGIMPAAADRIEVMGHQMPDGAGSEQYRSAALVERVRTKLTIVRGFSQILRRRQLRENPHGDLHELDRIAEAISELDELLYRFERCAG